MKSKLGGLPKKGESYKCKKCGYDVQETKMLSMSTRTVQYGRMTRDEAESNYYGNRYVNEEGESTDSEEEEDDEDESEEDEDEDE